MNVSVVGLGKLGCSMMVTLASKGHEVFGVDVNEEAVAKINDGVSPIDETDVQEMLTTYKERIHAHTDAMVALRGSEIIFVVVPTPSIKQTGHFDSYFVRQAFVSVGNALEGRTDRPLIVVTSTVSPGTMDKELRPMLEQCSHGKAGVHFGLCYNPEFIALGSVVKDMLNPDLILIGESDKESGDRLEAFQRDFCENEPHVARMNFANAELTKLAINTFITTKLSYANMIREICQRMPGGDVDAVTEAVGSDSRIGRKYIKGATAYGGACFPRDNRALAAAAKEYGAEASLAETTDAINDRQTEQLALLVCEHLPSGGRVGILGLTYKPHTTVIEESAGMKLVQQLLDWHSARRIWVYDPAGNVAYKVLGDRIYYADTPEECVLESDVIVLTTPWPEFSKMAAEPFSGRIVIDCWRVMPPEQVQHAAKYIALGVNPDT